MIKIHPSYFVIWFITLGLIPLVCWIKAGFWAGLFAFAFVAALLILASMADNWLDAQRDKNQ
jgi:hypothetical protein